MKKIISLLIVLATVAAIVCVSTGITAAGLHGDINKDGELDNKDVVLLFRYVSSNKTGKYDSLYDYNNDKEVNNKDVVALFRAVSSGDLPADETTTDTETEPTDTTAEPTDTKSEPDGTETEPDDTEPEPPEELPALEAGWDQTVSTANGLANGVQGKFTDAGRHKFLLSNQNASLLYDLSSNGSIGVSGIYNANGAPYFENTSDVKITLEGEKEFSAAASSRYARMNSHRLGYYYYDFRFCDQMFGVSEIKDQLQDGEDYYDIISKVPSWNVYDTSPVKKKNGVLSYTVTNSYDPYIMASSISFKAEDYDAVQITLKTEVATSGNFYIIAGSHNSYSEDQNISFRFNSGEWVTRVIPLSTALDYTGKVKGFRIDIGAVNGELIEIKELKAIHRGIASAPPFQLERIFHTYSDKLHEVVRIVASSEYEDGGSFASTFTIPASTVKKLLLKNKDGEASDLDGFDFSTLEFVGFDIDGAGVFGIIMPSLDDNGELKVELVDGNYVITHSKTISGTIKTKGDVYFGHRIYTTTSHGFDGLRKEAYIERNPLKNVKIYKAADSAKYVGYDALAGYYAFTVRGSDFNTAYYSKPNKHFSINASFKGDGVEDRTVYIRSSEPKGQLECAALLDENELMLPVPLEVGKNFKGEYEETFYDPDDTAYGEVYLPITVCKNETKKFSLLHLYQNWGNYPLKQLSFIAFHICYYHLSVGVTETNCIAPYFVYGKDGWTLPDFRANSAPLWSGQPQHTSAGRLYFLQYKDSDGNSYKSESQSADIVSAGPVYADINMEYLSDDGKIKATYRHAEMPQVDENRTYYNIKLEVLEDVSISNFKKDFSFFTFDGRAVLYSNVGYLDENGNMITEPVKSGTRYIKLGKQYPYYDYYGGNVTDSVNFALIVRNSDITIGGKKYDGNFIFRDTYDGTLNYGSLTLDLGKTTLKKGDVIDLDVILMPWGYSTSTDDHNVRGVREDSCFDPYKLTVIKGTAADDDFIPSVKADGNEAKFKLSGGKNHAAVRVYGFDKYTTPQITVKADGKAVDFRLNGEEHAYDGYQVYLDSDGTYSFSFVLNMDAADEYEVTVKQ